MSSDKSVLYDVGSGAICGGGDVSGVLLCGSGLQRLLNKAVWVSVVDVDISESVKWEFQDECPNCPLCGTRANSVKCCERLVRELRDGVSKEFKVEEMVSHHSLVTAESISIWSSFPFFCFLFSSPYGTVRFG